MTQLKSISFTVLVLVCFYDPESVWSNLKHMDHELEKHVSQNYEVIKRIGRGVCPFLTINFLGLWNCLEGQIERMWTICCTEKDF